MFVVDARRERFFSKLSFIKNIVLYVLIHMSLVFGYLSAERYMDALCSRFGPYKD